LDRRPAAATRNLRRPGGTHAAPGPAREPRNALRSRLLPAGALCAQPRKRAHRAASGFDRHPWLEYTGARAPAGCSHAAAAFSRGGLPDGVAGQGLSPRERRQWRGLVATRMAAAGVVVPVRRSRQRTDRGGGSAPRLGGGGGGGRVLCGWTDRARGGPGAVAPGRCRSAVLPGCRVHSAPPAVLRPEAVLGPP